MNFTRHSLRLTVYLSMTLAFAIVAAGNAFAQADQPIYTDSLTNGWQDYSWALHNLANTSPVHSGTRSVSVTASNYTGFYLGHAQFGTGPYTNLTFWINGGSTGGQHLKVQAHVNGNALT